LRDALFESRGDDALYVMANGATAVGDAEPPRRSWCRVRVRVVVTLKEVGEGADDLSHG
jgi:hypothetical protein